MIARLLIALGDALARAGHRRARRPSVVVKPGARSFGWPDTDRAVPARPVRLVDPGEDRRG